jgi:hypothetical protein
MNFTLFCAGCARPMSYSEAWRAGLVHTLVCGKECRDKVENDYCRAIVESVHAKKST